jgi:hypothetical protein
MNHPQDLSAFEHLSLGCLEFDSKGDAAAQFATGD